MISSGRDGFDAKENRMSRPLLCNVCRRDGPELSAKRALGLKRNEQPGPDPGRVGFLRPGAQTAANPWYSCTCKIL